MAKNEHTKRIPTAIAVTLAVHLGLGVLLYLLHLQGRIPEPKPIELVLIDLGNIEAASGQVEPRGLQQTGQEVVPQPSQVRPAPKPQPPTPAPTTPKPSARKPRPAPIQTQTHEESLRMAEAKRLEEAKRAEAKRAEEARLAAEAKARAEAEAAERREAQRRQAGSSVANAFGAGRGQNTSHGNASGVGNQGHPQGAAGGSFSLEGRTIVSNGGRLLPPSIARAIRGRVNVRITVDARGRVIEAHVDPRGTNIADDAVRRASVAAARATVFNTQEGAGEQRGLITYNFDIQ